MHNQVYFGTYQYLYVSEWGAGGKNNNTESGTSDRERNKCDECSDVRSKREINKTGRNYNKITNKSAIQCLLCLDCRQLLTE